MEKKFIIPELEIIFFTNDDIVTVSDPTASIINDEGSFDWLQ